MPKSAELDEAVGAEAGFAWVAREKLMPGFPPEARLDDLRRRLLENRGFVEENPPRQQALEVLWELALAAARFGTPDLDVSAGLSEFRLPPIPSSRLVDLEIISDEETIKQIKVREKAREKRGKKPPENRLVVKALSKEELEKLKLSGLRKPVLRLEEHYTVTLPQDPSVELDRVGFFVLFQNEQNQPQILFLGETQKPHAHAFAAGRWWRIDKQTYPDFQIPSGITLPSPHLVEHPTPATNDQIATLMVLIVEGIKSA